MNKLIISHANTRMTGTRLQVAVTPASPFGEGHVGISVTQQLVTTDPKNIIFDETSTVSIELNIHQVSKLMMVMRGYCESIDDGIGLIGFGYGDTHARLEFSHIVEPIVGYDLTVTDLSDADRKLSFTLSPCEAIGLETSLEGVMHLIAFGI